MKKNKKLKANKANLDDLFASILIGCPFFAEAYLLRSFNLNSLQSGVAFLQNTFHVINDPSFF